MSHISFLCAWGILILAAVACFYDLLERSCAHTNEIRKCGMGRVRKYRTGRMPKQKLRRESLLRILVCFKKLRASDTADLRHPGERGLVPGEAGGGQDWSAGNVLGRQRRVGPGGQPARWYERTP
jgi:hypothetical protein